ncbi:MAG TPA: YdcF family protein [Pyrinomonadaceae bacterium]|nr:YdcF family protein [Pyrinomonadaceae bacterium]
MKTKKQIIWRRIAVAVITLALLPVFAWASARLLVVRAPVSNADVIVVMSGSATFRERARHAAELYNQGRAPRIVLTNDYLQSSWSEKEQRNPYYYERSRDELRSAGVPDDKIAVIMVPITGTYDEVVLLKKYAQANQLSSLLVVTSAYHSRRALWTFRRVFQGSGKLIGMDPAEPGLETPALATWWLHRLGWEMVPKEYVKMLGYWFRY